MHLRLFLIFVFVAICLYSPCQTYNPENFKIFTTKDGLSNNNITDVKQDQYGYIWVSTLKGLNRFDGKSFKQYYSDSNRKSLPTDYIHKLRWLDKERLAVITISGLYIINTRTLDSRNLIIPADSLKSTSLVNRVFDATTDKKGNIFILTSTGFYHFNNKHELVFRYDHYSSEDVKKKAIAFGLNMAMPENNILLLATFFGPYIYNVTHKDLHPVGNKDDLFYRQINAPGKYITIPHGDENSFSVVVPGKNELYFFDITRKKNIQLKSPFRLPIILTSVPG